MNENETALLDAQGDVSEAPVIPEAEGNEASSEEEAPNAPDAADLREEIVSLKKELTLSKIKVSLLLAGVLREKLDEGAALALGLCSAGKTPEAAADEVAAEYPHLKAVQREMPQFAAGGTGSSDGFSAIRKIFMGR